MTRFAKWLGGTGFAVVLSLVLVGLGGAFSATDAAAETPPNPPARFGGTVRVDGATPTVGTVIEARVGSTSCGVGEVQTGGNYIVEVKAFDPGANPNCGTYNDSTSTGSVVTFYVGGVRANETGVWKNFQFNPLNLTVTTPPTPTATATATATASVSPTGTATTPGGTGTPGGGSGGTATTTPRPPVVGGVAESGEDSSLLLIMAVVGLGALAFGVSGATAARRSR